MKKQLDNFVFDLMDTLQSPVLTFSQSWKDLIPQRLLDTIQLSRMLQSLEKEEMASYEETVA